MRSNLKYKNIFLPKILIPYGIIHYTDSINLKTFSLDSKRYQPLGPWDPF